MNNLSKKTPAFQSNNISNIKVLLVEDNELLLHIGTRMLSSLNCEVYQANCAQVALDLVSNDIDLIFMDIGLPDMDGINLTKLIRNKYNHVKVPIIAYTTHDETIKQDCFSAGMNDYAQKPQTIDSIKMLIAKWLPNYLVAF